MYKGPVWNEERNAWLFKHGTESKKELYRLFCEAFPGVETTVYGVSNQRSRIGACARKNHNTDSRIPKPLYSEHTKGGYIYIKVAQPSTWWSKAKWVWIETHPGEYNTVKPGDNFVFLDGNSRNFTPSNIEKVSVREMYVINRYGVVPPGNPDVMMFHIAKARLTLAGLDAGEKHGLVCDYGHGRKFVGNRKRGTK